MDRTLYIISEFKSVLKTMNKFSSSNFGLKSLHSMQKPHLSKNIYVLIFFVMTLMVSGELIAQVEGANKKSTDTISSSTIRVKGTVMEDSDSAVAIPFVSVVIKGVDIGTQTDANGVYSISVHQNDTLVFKTVGYQSYEIVIHQDEANLIVRMKPVSSSLDDVIVVGYGVQKRASITGSVSTVQGKDLLTVKTPNVSNMLAGKLPGLRAAQRSGAPGDDGASVDIRGYGSMLIIVDGVQRDYSQLDANDIESITILKDGAAAVYGFKGSNGVLLVTTKKGTKSKPKLEYNGYYGEQKNTRYPRIMNAYEYASLYNEAIFNTNPWTGVAAYSDEQLQNFKNGTEGTDWWNEMVRSTAPQTAHNLSITGGSDKVSYYNSVGYLYQGGILRSGDWNFKRYNLRSNVNINVSNSFNIDVKISGRLEDRIRPYNADNLFRQAQMAIPTYSIYANNNPNYWQSVGDMANPVHTSSIDNAGYDRRIRREFNSSLTFLWKLPWVRGLEAKAMYAYDYENSEWKTWQKSISEYQYDASDDSYTQKVLTANSSLDSKMQNYYKPTQQYSLNYSNTFARKHNIVGLLLWESYSDRTTAIEGYRQSSLGLIDDINFGDALNQTTSGNSLETAHEGLVGRINYDFDKKYLLELSFRDDGSYKFQKGHRWGFFPGVSAGWRISEEPFFKKLMTGIDNLKIRGSYAKVGDEGDFDAYQYLEGYTYSGSYVLGDQGLSTGLASSGLANTWLTWYESKIVNLGMEASYLRGLISLEFDWFRRDRSGLPATRQGSLPTTFGETMPQENLNSDMNTGFEFSLGHKNTIGQFHYTVSGNFSITRIRNKYVERAASTNSYDNWVNNTNDRNTDIRWGRVVVGQFQSYEDIFNSPIQDNNGNKTLLPGDLKFSDLNKDGIIDDNDKKPIGRGATPRMYYGLNLSAGYKGFDLSAFFQGAAGHDIYISGDILDPFIQQGLGNGFAFMLDRWHRADPMDPNSQWISGTMPAARITGFSDNRSDNSWSLHKADYLRLKSLEISYSTTILKSVGISNVRIYANGTNLLTFTGNDPLLKLVDPESNSSTLRYYPQQKSYNVGLSVSF